MTAVNPERRTYGGQSGDERASSRRAALLEAALGLVAADGWRALTIEALCRRASLNKRYFYESFGSLEQVIEALTTDLAERSIAAALEAVDPDAPRAAIVRSAISAFVTHLTDDPRRARVLFGAVPAGEAIAGHRAAAIRQVIAAVAEEGRTIHVIPGADPRIELAAAMMVGGTSQAVLDWLDGRVECGREELVEELAVLWHALSETAAARARPGEA